MNRPLLRPRSHLLPFAAVALSAAGLTAQSVHYEKYVLPNGLTVILHEDHKAPIVAVNSWFKVGAKDEPAGRSGFAHLFEHLMFMGTQRVPNGDFDTIMEAGGGENNASTTEDRTNYFSVGPSSLLPTLLWLDADRLEDLGRNIDQQKLDRQREVVRNEIRQQVENEPYGRAQRATFALLFPPGHPYRETVYGSHHDLEAATVDDVRDFFATFYVPNNLSLVVAGDFDAAATKARIAALFGDLPRGPEPTRRAVVPTALDRVVRQTQLDRVELPLVRFAWHAPAATQPGTAELDLLAEVLADGKDSRLYRRLVEQEGLAVSVHAYLDELMLGSLFEIDVYAAPGADLDRLEAVVDEELDRLRREPVAAAELERRNLGREVAMLARLQHLAGLADQLNRYQYLYGEPDSFANDLARYRSITPAALAAALQQFLPGDRRAILRVLPLDREALPTNRDLRPAELGANTFRAPMPDELRLQNGLRVLLWPRHDLPLVNVRLAITPPAPLADAQHQGLPALAADLLDEGAAGLDAAAFAQQLEGLGASLSAWADHDGAGASLFTPARHLAAAARRFADAVRRPNNRQADFDRVQKLRLGRLLQAEQDPGSTAARVAIRTLFGDGDPYGWPAGGTLEGVRTATLEQVVRVQRALFAPDHATLLVAGDLTAAQAKAALDAAFGDWEPAGAAIRTILAPLPPALPPAPLRVLLVDRPDAAQTVVHLLAPAPDYQDDGRLRRQALSSLLGGSFTSRLNQNLRERHGFTYGAYAGFQAGPRRSSFVAGASVETPVTGAALREFLAEFARLRAPTGGDITAAELAKAQATLRRGIAEDYTTLGGLLGSAATYMENGLPPQQIDHDLAALAGVTVAALNDHARADLDLDHGVLVLVGDARQIQEQLAGLDLPAPTVVPAKAAPR